MPKHNFLPRPHARKIPLPRWVHYADVPTKSEKDRIKNRLIAQGRQVRVEKDGKWYIISVHSR